MLGKKVYSALNAKMVRNKVSLKAKQLSELRKALSEPTPAYDVDYRCWQKKMQFNLSKKNLKYFIQIHELDKLLTISIRKIICIPRLEKLTRHSQSNYS